jgi:hypothetical protein
MSRKQEISVTPDRAEQLARLEALEGAMEKLTLSGSPAESPNMSVSVSPVLSSTTTTSSVSSRSSVSSSSPVKHSPEGHHLLSAHHERVSGSPLSKTPSPSEPSLWQRYQQRKGEKRESALMATGLAILKMGAGAPDRVERKKNRKLSASLSDTSPSKP